MLIASKDSLRGKPEKVKSWLAGEEEVFLVVDEAHHATAKTYRTLIDLIKGYVPHVKIIGLTATPFRTLEAEKGLLSTIFKDGIIDGRVVQGQSGIAFQVGLQDLIGRQILSRPVMDMYERASCTATRWERRSWRPCSAGLHSEKIAQQMVDSRNRNKLIVQTYVNDVESTARLFCSP
ncbi:MAG: DEAD/DEAH box helicase family protein [Adlercreutzia equolifaciens]